jgi:hypothetical protein
MMAPTTIFKFLVIVVIDFIVGGLWHSDYMFANAWRKAQGFTKDTKFEPSPNFFKFFLSSMLLNILGLVIHWYFLTLLAPESLATCLYYSFLFWLGFMANLHLSACVWEQKPFALFAINTGFRLTTTMVFSLLYYLI